ncbi:3-hydroxyanthranilate 3-4-dioxygenase [Brachionus plicatilis]|uniref:3-hydroxyanthranilate 3,4-dioxygenase n=1 Tax=Brachionus plicatilis TaxID=10195 RepID=A0A3M7RV43_BRAPC|nr:3-hydroxyanthranilate 3-4-dioxygenase [Brachionus plicatilis]
MANVINVSKWIEENKSSFNPPVCNKLMHNEQLVVMFVGGPNQREDYHIEQGEELFYQLKGDMCVKIIENGQHRDVHIKEGEFFLLPARIPHSPQRTAGSIGLVIERKRSLDETDAVRWFVPNSTQVLYEKWFHCKDLGTELIPLIKTFFASEEYRTKIPGKNVQSEQPYSLNNVTLDRQGHGPFNFEARVKSIESDSANLAPHDLQFSVMVLKNGQHEFEHFYQNGLDLWLWLLKGSAQLTLNCSNTNKQQSTKLFTNDSFLVTPSDNQKLGIEVDEDALLIVIGQDPGKK